MANHAYAILRAVEIDENGTLYRDSSIEPVIGQEEGMNQTTPEQTSPRPHPSCASRKAFVPPTHMHLTSCFDTNP